MNTGRELLGRIADALERGAKAQEDLITLATEERDTGESLVAPPLCPHCGMFNPSVAQEGGGSGHMTEYVLVAKCDHCKAVIYAVPQGWLCYPNADMAREEIEGRNK